MLRGRRRGAGAPARSHADVHEARLAPQHLRLGLVQLQVTLNVLPPRAEALAQAAPAAVRPRQRGGVLRGKDVAVGAARVEPAARRDRLHLEGSPQLSLSGTAQSRYTRFLNRVGHSFARAKVGKNSLARPRAQRRGCARPCLRISARARPGPQTATRRRTGCGCARWPRCRRPVSAVVR